MEEWHGPWYFIVGTVLVILFLLLVSAPLIAYLA